MKVSENAQRPIIPIFPLACVVFPSEELQLHIFEDRYKEMINGCLARVDVPAKPFGITCVFSDTPAKVGCSVIVKEIVELYEDGRMDIKTAGLTRFEVLDVIRGKVYPQAEIIYFEDEVIDFDAEKLNQLSNTAFEMQTRLLQLVETEQRTLAAVGSKDFSFLLAHHAGLALEQRQAFIEMRNEMERLEYLIAHYQRVIPMIEQEEQVKRLIRLNGNLRKLSAVEL